MAAKYKNTNVKFNMDDPVQSGAYEYLQKYKGRKSYSRLISEAIVEKAESESLVRYENRDGEHILPDYRFSVTEDGLKLMSELIADRIGIDRIMEMIEEIRIMINTPGRDNASKNVIKSETSVHDLPVEAEEIPNEDLGEVTEHTDDRTATLSEEMLAFASG